MTDMRKLLLDHVENPELSERVRAEMLRVFYFYATDGSRGNGDFAIACALLLARKPQRSDA